MGFVSRWAEGFHYSIFCVHIYPSDPNWKASSDFAVVGFVDVAEPRWRRQRSSVHVLEGGSTSGLVGHLSCGGFVDIAALDHGWGGGQVMGFVKAALQRV